MKLIDEAFGYIGRTKRNNLDLGWNPISPMLAIQEILGNLEKIEKGDAEVEQIMRYAGRSPWFEDFDFQVSNTEVQRISDIPHFKTEHRNRFLREMKVEGIPPSLFWVAEKSVESFVLIDVSPKGKIIDLEIGIPKGIPEEILGFLIDMKLIAFMVYMSGRKCIEVLVDDPHIVSSYDIKMKFPASEQNYGEMESLLDEMNYEMFRSKMIKQAKDVWKINKCRKHVNKWLRNTVDS